MRQLHIAMLIGSLTKGGQIPEKQAVFNFPDRDIR